MPDDPAEDVTQRHGKPVLEPATTKQLLGKIGRFVIEIILGL